MENELKDLQEKLKRAQKIRNDADAKKYARMINSIRQAQRKVSYSKIGVR